MAYKHYVLVCGGTGCESSKADDIFTNLKAEVANAGLEHDVQVVKTGCFGFCEKGPIVKVLPEDAFYVEVKPSDAEEDAEEIVKETLIKGRIVKRLAYVDESGKTSAVPEEIGFYQKQMRIVLRNCGLIDPEKIDEYIARDGYAALEKVLFEMTPDQVIEEMKISGLRGRGGAGFPTWMKWNFTKQVESDVKYIVCNADEGDPGAYMDRSTLEGDPHSVLEAGSHGDCRLHCRRQSRLYLHPRRISSGYQTAGNRHGAGARIRTVGSKYSRQRFLIRH